MDDAEQFWFAGGHDCEVEHDWQKVTETYGEDADGNRGIYVTYWCCRVCGEER